MEESFLTVAKVAGILKLNQQALRNWIDRGELPVVDVGRRVRIKRSDFGWLIEEGSRGRRTMSEGFAASFWEGHIEHACRSRVAIGR